MRDPLAQGPEIGSRLIDAVGTEIGPLAVVPGYAGMGGIDRTQLGQLINNVFAQLPNIRNIHEERC